jgi:hypothetical protein
MRRRRRDDALGSVKFQKRRLPEQHFQPALTRKRQGIPLTVMATPIPSVAATSGALAGVRVVDMSRLLPGPLATQFLADFGAEVIKVEDTDGGDYGACQCQSLP